MIPRTRVAAIYRKELVDILRDRRTLMAMILVPVVLYPLLMLGFLRAAESEQVKLQAERFVVEFDGENDVAQFGRILQAVGQNARPGDDVPKFEARVGSTAPTSLGEQVQARMQLVVDEPPLPLPPRVQATITYNEVNVRSRTAMEQLTRVLEDFRTIVTRESVRGILARSRTLRGADVNLVLQPVEIKTVSAASERQRGGWALGQIVPIILVLMTITGAVYPAIDLTAGERERGTLETLMATPVPPLHLIVGKFLVVATVSLMAALLNVASVGATMHFGGLTRAISSEMPVEFPLGVLPIMLLCMVPFAILFSAILVAVCSFARTFKEAQNYVMPVIILAMVPGIAVTLPTVQLRGIMLVMPVGNMVLLARELFQQTYQWMQVAVVLTSTTLYAAAAVAVAARLFGQEAVMFADSRSYRMLLSRRYFEPADTPTASQSLLLAALLFPASFYAQSLVVGASIDRFIRTMSLLAVVQFLGLFVVLPLLVCWYLRINPVRTFRLKLPPVRAWAGALLVGLSSWAIAQELFALQCRVIRPSQALLEFSRQIESQLASAPLWAVVLLLAVIPGITEEFLFRGFVLSGVSHGLRKWPAILAVATVFGVFHFVVDRIPVSAMMGVVLGYICWQSRSILPGMLAHAMHNAMALLLPQVPVVHRWLGEPAADASPGRLLPLRVFGPALGLFVVGLLVFASIRTRDDGRSEPVASHP